MLSARVGLVSGSAVRVMVRAAVIAVVAVLTASAIQVAPATAAPSFDGVVLDARLVVVDPATALALGSLAVAVSLLARRRRFEGAFAGFLAVLLFAFRTVRNSLPGIPPVGVLFDYAAFFWAEALVALALIALITGWTVRALVGTTERRN